MATFRVSTKQNYIEYDGKYYEIANIYTIEGSAPLIVIRHTDPVGEPKEGFKPNVYEEVTREQGYSFELSFLGKPIKYIKRIH